MARYLVAGITSWGVTLAWLLARRGNEVVMAGRTPAEATAADIRRGLERLPEIALPAEVTFAAPGEEPAPGVAGIVAAVPAQALRATLSDPWYPRNVPVVSAAKGIELATEALMAGVLRDLGWPESGISALSGPNLAHEIARGMPAAAVVACRNEASARSWQEAFSSGAFRVYRTGDVTGVEVAGALKNVVAIAVGAGFGLGFGANVAAAIVTRGLAEMTRIGVAMGAEPMTFQGLAGVGDLAATCFSPLSRNYRLGEMVARGASPDEAKRAIGEVVEGAATAPIASRLAARLGVETPITDAVAAALAGRITVAAAMESLLSRRLKPEEFARF